MDPLTLRFILIAIVVFSYVGNLILDILNYRTITPQLPDRVKDIYSPEKYQEFVRYKQEQYRFSFVTGALGVVVMVAFLTFGWFGKINQWLLPVTDEPIMLALLYFGVLFIASDLLQIPFQWYSTFVIEQKFGFNKTTPKTFWLDKLKGYVLTVILGGGILYVLLWLILEWGPSFWLYFLVFASLFTLIINVFYTRLILPLFNKLTPLSNQNLKQAITDYAQRVNFPLKNVYEMDGSKRSTKANAFFTGLGKQKKVVLFDTLIEQHEQDELVAVFAHEVGHYKHKHIISGYILSVVQLGIMLFILSLMAYNQNLSLALGANDWYIHLNLIAFFILYSPLSLLTGLLGQIFSRKNEYQADAYAVKTYRADPLKNALKKLSVNTLSHLTPHPAYVFFHYSHPPLLNRLRHIDSNS